MPTDGPPSSPPPPQGEDDSATSRTSRASSSIAPGPLKKPRYLLVALIMALVFGAGCWTEGCGRLAFYRGEHNQAQSLNASIKSDVDRGRAEDLYRRFGEVADNARARAIPLAAATFVLGAALLALASRALAGKTNTRTPLIQVVVAQAAIVMLSFFLTRDVRNAELDWDIARNAELDREVMRRIRPPQEADPAQQYEQMVPAIRALRTTVIDPAWLVLRTIASALIVFALTRQRSRAFFDAAGGTTVSER
jgi:hypothetical protein